MTKTGTINLPVSIATTETRGKPKVAQSFGVDGLAADTDPADLLRRETLDRWERFEATGEAVDHEAVAAWLETWGTDREGTLRPE